MEFISRDAIEHCIKRNPNKLEGRATAGMLIIFLVLSLLGWIYLTQASHVATTSRRNQDLETEKALLRQENMELMVEIAEYESVSRLAARAQALGFVAVAPDEAEFMAVAAPVSERSWMKHPVARTRQQDGVAQAAGLMGNESLSALSVVDTLYPAGEPILRGVKAQFTAWIRAETQ
jgi:hypothetical protein